MRIPSIQAFREALINASFPLHNTLGGGFLGVWQPLEKTCCCRRDWIEGGGLLGPYVIRLYAPQNAAIEQQMAYVATLLSGSLTTTLPDYRLLHGGLRYTDRQGEERQSNGVVEILPLGRPLSEVLSEGVSPLPLLGALKQLEEDLRRLGLSHNNLKAEHLWLTQTGVLMATRLHYATHDEEHTTDYASFRALERLIGEAASATPAEQAASSQPATPFRQEGPPIEGLIRISHGGRYGFISTRGEVIIEPLFRWASDFQEGRAEVMGDKGVGVIDKQGRFIVEPLYEDVNYDPRSGEIRVRQDGLWAVRSYEGEWLTDFEFQHLPAK